MSKCTLCDEMVKLRFDNLRSHLFRSHPDLGPELSARIEARRRLVRDGKPSYRDPQQCPDCGKQLSSRRSVNKHRALLHQGGHKPFVCDACQKGFALNYHLARHVASCNGNPRKPNRSRKRFSCDHCEKEFVSKLGLQRHVTIIHQGKPWPYDAKNGKGKCSSAFAELSRKEDPIGLDSTIETGAGYFIPVECKNEAVEESEEKPGSHLCTTSDHQVECGWCKEEPELQVDVKNREMIAGVKTEAVDLLDSIGQIKTEESSP